MIFSFRTKKEEMKEEHADLPVVDEQSAALLENILAHQIEEINPLSSTISDDASSGEKQPFRLFSRQPPKVIDIQQTSNFAYQQVAPIRKYEYDSDEERELQVKCQQVAVDLVWLQQESAVPWVRQL